jgi:hypothetical protein
MDIKFKKFLAHKMPIYKTNQIVNKQNQTNNDLIQMTKKMDKVKIKDDSDSEEEETKPVRKINIKPLKFKF